MGVSSYGISALTSDAARLYLTDTKKFLSTCGDQFVIQENLGARLYISSKLDFATKQEKNSFQIDASWLLTDVMSFFKLGVGYLAFNFITHKVRVTFSIAVLQEGGDINVLRKAVPEIAFEDSGMGVFTCIKNSGGNIDEKIKQCQAIMNKLLDYASGSFIDTVDRSDFEASQTMNYYREYYTVIGINASAIGGDIHFFKNCIF